MIELLFSKQAREVRKQAAKVNQEVSKIVGIDDPGALEEAISAKSSILEARDSAAAKGYTSATKLFDASVALIEKFVAEYNQKILS